MFTVYTNMYTGIWCDPKHQLHLHVPHLYSTASLPTCSCLLDLFRCCLVCPHLIGHTLLDYHPIPIHLHLSRSTRSIPISPQLRVFGQPVGRFKDPVSRVPSFNIYRVCCLKQALWPLLRPSIGHAPGDLLLASVAMGRGPFQRTRGCLKVDKYRAYLACGSEEPEPPFGAGHLTPGALATMMAVNVSIMLQKVMF